MQPRWVDINSQSSGMEIPSTFVLRSPSAQLKTGEEIDLKRYWRAIKRRFLPAAGAGSVVLALTVGAIISQKASYTAVGKLLIKPDETPSLTGLDSNQMREFEPLTIQSNPLKTEIEILRSQPLLKRAIDTLQIANAAGEAPTPSVIGEGLEVDVSGGTDVIQVVYSADDPALAAAMVNTLMELYIANNIELNQAEAVNAREFITNELPSAEAAVQSAELELSRFKQANQLVTIEDEARSAVEFVTRLDEQIATVQSDLASANAQLSVVQSRLGVSAAEALDLSAISQSEGVQEALGELQTVETELVQARSFFKDNSPQVISLQNKASSLRSLLQSRVGQVVGNQSALSGNLQIGDSEQALIDSFVNLEVQRLGLANQVKALDLARGSYAQRMSDLPGLERQQRILERRLDAVKATYETLLTNLQTLKTSENQALGNARIIELAQIPNSATLNQKTVAMGLGGGLLSLLVFGAVVMLLESRDRSVKTLEDLKQIYGCDLLEAIPSQPVNQPPNSEEDTEILPVSNKTWVSVRDYPRSLVSEIYRSLQVKLQYFNEVRAFKTVTVISATPEEGGSEVAANLAMATAELKQKILLIDANLRSPNQSLLWHVEGAEMGLSHVLQGTQSLPEAIVQVAENLWVLPAGIEPPSPLALLRSPKMQTLIRAAAKSFDAIVIDSPSLLSAPDGLVLGKLSDGVVVVSRLGEADRTNLVAASDALQKSHQSVLGLVATGASEKDLMGDRWLYEPSAAAHLSGSAGAYAANVGATVAAPAVPIPPSAAAGEMTSSASNNPSVVDPLTLRSENPLNKASSSRSNTNITEV